MLEVNEIHTYYGESHILQGLSLQVKEGEVVAILGPNGMGKTTTLRSIMGLTPPRSGTILFKQEDITHLRPFQIARKGIGYVPEDRGIFISLTVLQNLRIPYLNKRERGEWSADLDRVFTLFPQLRERSKMMAGNLSGGEAQMLATARGLIAGHQVLFMDEPTEGLAPKIVQILLKTFKQLKEEKLTILLVEQNIKTAFEIADRCYILEKGRIKVEDTISEIKKKPDVLHRYLGL